MDSSRILLAQLRHNYNSGTPFKSAKLFGPRFDSQDAWILHSNFNIDEAGRKLFNFGFGTPGCDNKLVYLFKILGYEIINDPLAIKIYHLHRNMARNYQHKPLAPPWGLVSAADVDITKHVSTLGIDIRVAYNHTNQYRSFSFTDDNIVLGKYIFNKLSDGDNFIIPRIAGTEIATSLLACGAHEYLFPDTSIPTFRTRRRSVVPTIFFCHPCSQMAKQFPRTCTPLPATAICEHPNRVSLHGNQMRPALSRATIYDNT